MRVLIWVAELKTYWIIFFVGCYLEMVAFLKPRDQHPRQSGHHHIALHKIVQLGRRSTMYLTKQKQKAVVKCTIAPSRCIPSSQYPQCRVCRTCYSTESDRKADQVPSHILHPTPPKPFIPYPLLPVGLGFIFLLPPVRVTLTNLRVYCIRFFARPLGTFFFSCGSTFGVWDLTFPARARDPWTFPMIAVYRVCGCRSRITIEISYRLLGLVCDGILEDERPSRWAKRVVLMEM